MPASATPGKPSVFKRRYLLDARSQLAFGRHVLGILAGIGVLYACAVYYLLGTELLDGQSVAQARRVLLLVHTGYFVIGGAILFVAVLILTHRFVGPGHVMRQAVAKLRRGDFTGRLGLRRRDALKELAEELRLLRDEMAERDAARSDAYERLEAALDAGDLDTAQGLLAALRTGTARARRVESAERSTAA